MNWSSRYTFRLLRAGRFRLDAGSMFGLIPRSVWSRSVPIDDKGRMEVQHNCLLLERVGDAPSGTPRRVLIECGSGDKLDDRMRAIFDFETSPATGRQRCITDALAEIGVAPESIDAVIVSHLHFDHAGGLTRLARPGETPSWPVPPNDDGGGGSRQTGGCVLTFPKASVFVQEREWRDALVNRSVMTKTYYPDHLHPIEKQIRLVDSPRPFPTGLTPGREDPPLAPLPQRLTELWRADPTVPGSGGLFVFCVPGHTWGQQGVVFREPDPPAGRGRTIVFTPDVLPTVHHSGAAYSLGYDVEPYTSMLSRRWLLAAAAEHGWVLCLDHEPGNPLVRVRPDDKGWFTLVPDTSP